MAEELVHVKGMEALGRMLLEFPDKLQKRLLGIALRAGARVVKKAVIQELERHVETGELLKGIKIRTRTRRGTVTVRIVTEGKHAYVAHWLEFGTAAHAINARRGGFLFFDDRAVRSVKHPGQAATPFMRPSLQTQAQAATMAAAEKLKERLGKAGFLSAGMVELEAGEDEGDDV